MKSRYILFFLLLMCKMINAQVSVNVLITPPYSPYYEDYLQYDNKVIIILTNTTLQAQEVYFKGEITGDNGMSAVSKSNYKPSFPIDIPANGTIQLSGGDLEEYLSFNSVDLTGISEQELLSSEGLPEGNYQICIQVFNYIDDSPLSLESPIGCSNRFDVAAVEPPIINFPLCEAEVLETTPQSVLFSWSMNTAYNPNFIYLLQIAELQPDQAPGAALDALSSPGFFEQIIITNSYLYGISDPPFELGKKYVFRVQAIDQSDKTVFRNNGFSEPCTFTYGIQNTVVISDDSTNVYIPNLDIWDGFTYFNNTKIEGRLLYKFKDELGIPQTNLQNIFASPVIYNTSSYLSHVYTAASTNSWNTTSSYDMLDNITLNTYNPLGGLDYVFENTVSANGAKPLSKTTVKLVLWTALLEGSGDIANRKVTYNPIDVVNGQPTGALGGNEISLDNATYKIIDVKTTDDDGSFTFDFRLDGELGFLGKRTFSYPGMPSTDPTNAGALIGGYSISGDYYQCLKIIVDDPRFYSPDIDILPKEGQQLTIPDQVALINDYSVKIKVKAKNRSALFAGNKNILDNTEIRILRDKQRLDIKKEILYSEGQKLSSYTEAENFGTFKDVAFEFTDKNGYVEIKRLVANRYGDPYYMMRIATRDPSSENEYENTLYNYETVFQEMVPSWFDHATSGERNFNRDYKKKVCERSFELKALPPEIKGRIMETSNLEAIGLAGVRVKLLNQSTNSEINSLGKLIDLISGTPESWYPTQSDGFYSFRNLSVDVTNNKASGPYRRLKIDKYGYEKVYRNPLNFKPWNLSYGELKDIKDVFLVPMGKIKGKIKGENGEPLECMVKVGEGAFYKTEFSGNTSQFEMLAEKGYNVHLLIQPLSDDYQEESFYIHIDDLNKGQYQDVGTFTLTKNKKRLEVLVKLGNGQLAKGAKVSIDDLEVVAEADGKANFAFNSTKSSFRLTVTFPFYPPYQGMISIPNSTAPKKKTVILSPGKVLSGVIKEYRSPTVIEGAKLSVLINTVDGHDLRIETTSTASGKYTLMGIPANFNSIKVEVTVEGGIKKYLALAENVAVPQNLNTKDFTLTPLGSLDLSEIWGFPVSITKIEGLTNNSATINGYFYNMPILGDFKADENLKAYFYGVKLSKNAQGKFEPISGEIQLNKTQIPIKIQNEFNAKLLTASATSTGFVLQDYLKLRKNSTGKGYIEGIVKIPSTPLDKPIYVGSSTSDPKQVIFGISNARASQMYAFTVVNGQTKPLDGFKIYGMTGLADIATSSVKQGKILLPIALDVKLPLSKPESIPLSIGIVQLTQSSYTIQEGAITMPPFDLEKWHITPKKPLTVNAASSTFTIPELEINTGIGVKIAVKDLYLKNNTLSGGTIDLSGGLSLAGVADLIFNTSISPTFNYDQGTNHYRVNMASNSNLPAASIKNLPGLGNQNITFTSIGLQSNNVNPLSISQKVSYHNILELEIDKMTVAEDQFTLSGNVDLGLPGEIFQTCQLKFSKASNQVVSQLLPIRGYIQNQGRVDFVFDHANNEYQKISDKDFSVYGAFKVKPENPSEKAFSLRGWLHKTPAGTTIDVINTDGSGKKKGSINQKLVLGSANSYYTIVDGGTSVMGNKWEFLEFSGKPNTYEGMDDSNIMSFQVVGDMTANADGLKADNIDTPFGSLSMIYDFAESALEGNLSIDQPIEMGAARISQGEMRMRFDKNGYYIGLGADMLIGASLDVQGGIIFGNSSQIKPAHVHEITNAFGYGKKMLPSNLKNQRIEGIFFGGQRTLLSTYLPLPPVGINADAGLGAYFTLDFSSGTSMSLGGYAYAKVNTIPVGLPGCTLCAGLEGLASITGGYNSSSGVYIDGCGSLQLAVEACGINGSFSIGNKVSFSSANGVDVSFFFDSDCANSESKSLCH